MSDQTNIPEAHDSKVRNNPEEANSLEEQRKSERVANDAAEEAGRTEQRYDQDHDLFTK